jgi:hypothetical protein
MMPHLDRVLALRIYISSSANRNGSKSNARGNSSRRPRLAHAFRIYRRQTTRPPILFVFRVTADAVAQSLKDAGYGVFLMLRPYARTEKVERKLAALKATL